VKTADASNDMDVRVFNSGKAELIEDIHQSGKEEMLKLRKEMKSAICVREGRGEEPLCSVTMLSAGPLNVRSWQGAELVRRDSIAFHALDRLRVSVKRSSR